MSNPGHVPNLSTKRHRFMQVVTEITSAQFELFCKVSEDRNPIHVSPETARTTSFGRNIVFGVQTALTALEHFVADGGPSSVRTIRSMTVRLPVPVYPDETLRIEGQDRSGDAFQITVSIGDTTVCRIKLELGGEDIAAPSPDVPIGPVRYLTEPLVRHMDHPLPVRGRLPLGAEVDPADLFPALCRRLGGEAVMSLVRLSTIVGMEWPGLYSVLSEFKVNFEGGDAKAEGLEFVSERVDDRVSMTWVEARSRSLSSEVTAMFRPLPVVQPGYQEVRRSFDEDFAHDQTCLIIGASRGLGEVAAKAFAAAGGRPTLSYFASPDRAEAVAQEIRDGGGVCQIVRLDVNDPDMVAAHLKGREPYNALMYFATPHIFRRRTEAFSSTMFNDFAETYVHSFHRTVSVMMASSKSPLRVLYPSTVAVDEPVKELTEYSAAKAAGESVCRTLERQFKRLTVDIVRFPRIETDQTNTIATAVTADPVMLLFPVLRRLCGVDVA